MTNKTPKIAQKYKLFCFVAFTYPVERDFSLEPRHRAPCHIQIRQHFRLAFYFFIRYSFCSVVLCCPIHFSFWTVDSCTVVIRITEKSALTAMLCWLTTCMTMAMSAVPRRGKWLFSTECGQWFASQHSLSALCVEWEFMQCSCSIAVYH